MAFSIDVLPRIDLVLITFSSTVDDRQAVDFAHHLQDVAASHPQSNVLVILEDDLQIRLDTTSIRDFARKPAAFDEHTLQAIVAGTKLGFGLARLYAIEANREHRMSVFQDIRGACEYLGIEKRQLGMDLVAVQAQ